MMFYPRSGRIDFTHSQDAGMRVYAQTQIVSFTDLHAGKIVASLNRQPPNLFDIRDVLANEGISDDLRRAFTALVALRTSNV